MASRTYRISQRMRHVAAILATATLIAVAAGRPCMAQDKVLYDFEQPDQLNAWSANEQEQATGRKVSIEAPEVTSADKALKIVCTGQGTDWPGIASKDVPADWTGYEALKMDVYSVNPLPLSVRIDDSKSTDYPNRFNLQVQLQQKKTVVQIPVESIARSINPKDIKMLCLFLTKPPAGTTIYIASIRLGTLETEKVSHLPFEQRKDAPYTDTVKTPTAWRVKPMAGGPVKLFAIPSIQYGRELVELAERLDIKYGLVTWDSQWDQNTWGLGDHYDKRGHRFSFKDVQDYLAMELGGASRYDVYLLRTPVGWKWFPKAAREALLERVKDGAGLVLVQPFSGDEKFDASDLWSISPLINCKTDRMEEPSGYMRTPPEGMVAGEPWQVADSQHYIVKDLPLDLLPFKAMSYRKYQVADESQVLIKSQSGDPIVAVRQYGKGRVVTLAYRSFDMTPYIDQPAGSPPPVDYSYWEISYALVGRCVLWAAGRETPLSIPEDFTRQAKAATANPIILDVPDTASFGEKIRVRTCLVDDKSDFKLQSVELRDGYGRTLERSDLTISTVYLPTSKVCTWAAQVVVTAGDHQGNRVSKSVPVILQRPKAVWDDYEVIMWPNERLPWQQNLIYQQMRAWGCTATLDPSWENNALMRERLINNLRIVPHGVRRKLLQQNPDAFAKQKQQYELTKDKKYLERFICISDPKIRQQEELSLWKTTARLALLRPLAWCIGEEDSLASYRAELDLCFAAPTLRKFRAYLRQKYESDLAALNKHWGTKFAVWDRVVPMTSEEAKAHENFAPWAEHRTFMDNEWAGIYSLYLGVLKSVDNPDVLMGTSGTQVPTPHDGQDWYKLMPNFGWLSSYTYGHQDEMHMDFAKGKPYITAATGYGISADNARYQLWTRLLHGNAGAIIFWWLAIQNPDLSICQAGQDLGAVIGELKSGVGKLVFEATRLHDPIAVHYSIPSMQAGWITTGSMKAYEDAVDAWWTALQELGYQPVFVAGQQIEQGQLAKDGFKALVMPRSVALSQKEKDQIDAFVKAGGIVLGSKCDVGKYDADLAPNMVAMVPQNYETVDPAGQMELVSTALSKAHVQPPVRLESTTGATLKGLEIVRYQLDDMQMVGILRPAAGQKQVVGNDGVIRYEPDPTSGKAVEPVRISMAPITGPIDSWVPFVFNARTHQQLKTDVVDGTLVVNADLPAGDALLLAQVYPLTPPVLRVANTVEQGNNVEITIRSDSSPRPIPASQPAERAAPRHVIRLEVRQPDGTDAPWLTRNVVVRGQEKVSAAVAFNDKPGTWTLTATDIVTGAKATGEFTVTSKATATQAAKK